MMKKEYLLNILLSLAVVFICIRLFSDFDPALLGATICIAMYMGIRFKKDK